MPNQNDRKNRHFILKGFTNTERFIRPRQFHEPTLIPEQDRNRHGSALMGQIKALEPTFIAARKAQEDAGLEGGFGLQVEFESFPDIELAFESLARERSGIELLNVRHNEHQTYATVFVPDGKLAHFENLIRDYLAEKRDSAGRTRDHKTLINTIRQIRTASLTALWTDDPEVFPAKDDEAFWWEVWLPIRNDRAASIKIFRKLAESQGFQLAPGEIEFPERSVLIAHGTARQMANSMMTLNSIAELRRAKETAAFFDALPPQEQPAWLDDLLRRCQFPGTDEQVPYVCLLVRGSIMATNCSQQ